MCVSIPGNYFLRPKKRNNDSAVLCKIRYRKKGRVKGGGAMYRSLLSISLLTAFFSLSFAETIQFKSGQKVEGKVIERIENYLMVKAGDGKVEPYMIGGIETIDGITVDLYEKKQQDSPPKEREGFLFTKPSAWINNPVKDKRAMSFYTSNDPERRFTILARTIYAPKQTAHEWAIDEMANLRVKGEVRQVTQPRSVSIGDSDWIILEWEHVLHDPQKGAISIKGQQYYSKKNSKHTLIEVSVMGTKKSFDTVGTKEIYDFLLNAKIESRSTSEIDAIKKMGESELEKKSQLPSSTEIVGTWEMVYQKNGNLILDNDIYIYPYQRFSFFSDGYVKNIGTTEPFDEKALRIWEVAPKTSKYRFTEKGVLLIEGSAGDLTPIIISVITEDLEQSLRPDAPKLKKGDLILSYLNSKNQVYLQRYLRKVGDGEKNNSNDTIVFKTGKSIEGKIIERSNEYIKIDFFGVPLTHYFDEIQSINGKSPILAAKETEVSPVNLPGPESPVTESMLETKKSDAKLKPVDELSFSTAIITYKYKGSRMGKETVYIDAVNNKIAQEFETSGRLMGRVLTKREMNICDGNMFYHIDLEKNRGTKEEWRGNCVTAVFREKMYLDYYSGDGSFLGKVCKVYKPTFGTAYFWNGIILKEEITNHPFGKELNYTREAVGIQLDVKIPAEKFHAPSGIKLLTGEEVMGEMKQLFEKMKAKYKK